MVGQQMIPGGTTARPTFCSGCGAPLREHSQFCTACGLPVAAPLPVTFAPDAAPPEQAAWAAPPEMPAPVAPSAPAGGAQASLVERVLAQFVDGLVAFGVFWLTGSIIANRTGDATERGFNLTGGDALLALGIVIVVMLGYFLVAEASIGATLGKLAAGIRVRNAGGGRPGVAAVAVRTILRLVDGIGFYLVGAVTMSTTPRRQRLGDMAAGTLVVREAWPRSVRVAGVAAAVVLAVTGTVAGLVVREPAAPAVTVTLAREVTENFQPVQPTTTFAPEATVIAGVFHVKGAARGDQLKSVWIAVDVGDVVPDVVPPETVIDDHTLTLNGGDETGSVRLRRGPDPWPAGEYRLEIYLNDQLLATQPFSVVP